jgi:hypothetical protein
VKFKREFIDARVQAYVETCRELAKYPDRVQYQEFAAELSGLAKGGTDDIVRAYKDPLKPLQHRVWKECWSYFKSSWGRS